MLYTFSPKSLLHLSLASSMSRLSQPCRVYCDCDRARPGLAGQQGTLYNTYIAFERDSDVAK